MFSLQVEKQPSKPRVILPTVGSADLANRIEDKLMGTYIPYIQEAEEKADKAN